LALKQTANGDRNRDGMGRNKGMVMRMRSRMRTWDMWVCVFSNVKDAVWQDDDDADETYQGKGKANWVPEPRDGKW